MRTLSSLTLWMLATLLVVTSAALGRGEYIGYVYPAGGQQGTTFTVRLGGQRLTGVYGAEVTGQGVKAEVVDYYWRMSPQDRRLMSEQIKIIRKQKKDRQNKMKAWEKAQKQKAQVRKDDKAKDGKVKDGDKDKKPDKTVPKPAPLDPVLQKIEARIQKRFDEYQNRPATRSLSELVFVKITVANDAEPGAREIRLITPRGVTNPMTFMVGQYPEVAREAMKTAQQQVLGKEEASLRHRPADQEEVAITVPCTMNGQIASGEKNSYRFKAKKGQRLVIRTHARKLIPYVADAVPGWFQPVLSLRDADGREVAYNDDFRFKPDPLMLVEVPADGEYVLTITDALFRGREDWVYRITIGEIPFITSIFPLGRAAGEDVKVGMEGWHLDKASMQLPAKDAAPGVHMIAAKRQGKMTNAVPFAVDTLPEVVESDSNDETVKAQKLKMPVIVNGRIEKPDDWDVFAVDGKAGQTIVAEVTARRLDSPMDSFVKLTDAEGEVLAFNDDHEDPGTGLNTHHADSYIMYKLPADGKYFIHLGEATRRGGTAYGYRLRVSEPRPDFALRTEPSAVSMRTKNGGNVAVYAIRRDGFNEPIKLALADPPDGFTGSKPTLAPDKEKVGFRINTTRKPNGKLIPLTIEGTAKIGDKMIRHVAVGADDMMQAFLWRHLVPAEQFVALIEDRGYKPKDVRPEPSQKVMDAAPKPKQDKARKFSKKQAAGELRRLNRLYDDWLITERFYARKVAECNAGSDD